MSTTKAAELVDGSDLVDDSLQDDEWSVRSFVGLVGSRWKVFALSILLPLGLYIVLRPENYGLTPNSLDPMFYTGYSINFDDILNAAGDDYYFVTRWSVYLPMYVADRLVGPVVGRLLWRLALASMVLLALWTLGKRWRWTLNQRILIGIIVLSTPMFVRAFFTDYTEYTVVGLGIPLVCLCLRERHTWCSAGAVGVLSGLIVTANLIAVTAIVPTVFFAFVVGSNGLRNRLWLASVMVGGAFAVILGGLLLFRLRYGIDNVYWPSIEFARTFEGTLPPDPWRHPVGDWLPRFTWLYAVPALVLFAVLLSRRGVVRFDRIEVAALGLCSVQYVYQWVDEFVRGGYGLSLSYYWAFSLPSFLVALAVVVGRLTQSISWRGTALLGGAWTMLLLIGVPDRLHLPLGALFGFLAVAVVVIAVAVARRSAAAGLTVFLALIVWMQVGAPPYTTVWVGGTNISPNYDVLYRQAGNLSETTFDEAVWFAREMDRVPNDASASFVPIGGRAGTIVAVYAPHVTRPRNIVSQTPELRIDEAARREIKAGLRPILAVLGPPADVLSLIETFPEDLGVGTKILDVTHDSALGYRLVVFNMPDAARLPFTWSADSLFRTQGRVIGSEVFVDSNNSAGVVTYGPYKVLQPGSYSVQIEYRSILSASGVAGFADVGTLQFGPAQTKPLKGTNGATGVVTINFVVEQDQADLLWEFRSGWSGDGDLTVERITLSSI